MVKKTSEKTDVCIIGSGAGGAVVAKELGEMGVRVVVLEAGRRFNPLKDYTSARADWEFAGPASVENDFRVPCLDKVTMVNKASRRPGEAHGVGGSTLRYLAYAVRMRPDDFRGYSVDGIGMDWPISYEELVPYYRNVEVELGVSGLSGDPWTPLVKPYLNPPFDYSYANKILKRGFDKLGLALWPTPMARLSRPFNGRPRCNQCGNCDMGCMTEAKSSMDVSYLRKAENTGKVTVRPESIVTQITVDGSGKAKGVVYVDKNGTEHEILSQVVVVSAGSIQSPRLLLNSRSNLYPDGLGNSSGLVGKYFMQHITVRSAALFPDRIDSFRGFFGGATSQDLGATNPKNAYVRGWCHELHSGFTTPVRMANASSMWGNQLKQYMRKNFGHSAGLTTVGEQLADIRNCIDTDPEVKDEYGMPVARISLNLVENDLSMITAMKRNVLDIYDAAGASDILNLKYSLGASPHNLGSCRMGIDPKTSVLNSFCQSHDVRNLFVIDGSCFVSSGTANPSLTIHAIGVRSSTYIVEQGRKGDLG